MNTFKGPADAKYVAETKANDILIHWTAGDQKGEFLAKNRFPAVAKKNDKNKTPDGNPEKAYLSGLTVQKGFINDIILIIVMAKSSKAQYVKVTKDTRFIVTDSGASKTYDYKSVLADDTAKAAFSERYVTLVRQANVVLSVTAPAKKK